MVRWWSIILGKQLSFVTYFSLSVFFISIMKLKICELHISASKGPLTSFSIYVLERLKNFINMAITLHKDTKLSVTSKIKVEFHYESLAIHILFIKVKSWFFFKIVVLNAMNIFRPYFWHQFFGMQVEKSTTD